MPANSNPVLCSDALQRHRHVCAIFNGPEEAREIISDYLVEGWRRSHVTLAMVNPDSTQEMVDDLKERGMSVEHAINADNFWLRTWHETYLRDDGRFSAEAMVDFVARHMKAAREAGHGCVWATGDMNWASGDSAASTELVRYEAQLNTIKPQFDEDVWVCFYDSNLFSGRVIADIIRAHPVVLMGKKIFENPAYTEPAALLEELADWEIRRSRLLN